MAWRVELSEQVRRQLQRLDREPRRRIERFMVERLTTEEDPRRLGAPTARHDGRSVALPHRGLPLALSD